MTLHARHGSHGPSELTRLQQEVYRLSAVLELILEECDEAPIGPADKAIVAIQRIIRAALTTGKHDG